MSILSDLKWYTCNHCICSLYLNCVPWNMTVCVLVFSSLCICPRTSTTAGLISDKQLVLLSIDLEEMLLPAEISVCCPFNCFFFDMLHATDIETVFPSPRLSQRACSRHRSENSKELDQRESWWGRTCQGNPCLKLIAVHRKPMHLCKHRLICIFVGFVWVSVWDTKHKFPCISVSDILSTCLAWSAI